MRVAKAGATLPFRLRQCFPKVYMIRDSIILNHTATAARLAVWNWPYEDSKCVYAFVHAPKAFLVAVREWC